MASLNEQKETARNTVLEHITAMLDDAIASGDIGKVRHTAIQFTERWLKTRKLAQLNQLVDFAEDTYGHLVDKDSS